MPYSSSLSDKEWEIIEPLLPHKKQTRHPLWTKRQILDGIFYQLKNGSNWCDLPCIFTALQGRCFGISLQWRETGVLERMMTTLLGDCARTRKKKLKWTTLLIIDFGCSQEYLQYRCRVQRVLSLQMYQWHQTTLGSSSLSINN